MAAAISPTLGPATSRPASPVTKTAAAPTRQVRSRWERKLLMPMVSAKARTKTHSGGCSALWTTVWWRRYEDGEMNQPEPLAMNVGLPLEVERISRAA